MALCFALNVLSGTTVLTQPGVLPEGIFLRRIRDGSSVVGDRRGCHYDDNLQHVFLLKPAAMNESSSCSLKCPRFRISVLARVESAANRLFAGACPLANPAALFGADPLLECQCRMETR